MPRPRSYTVAAALQFLMSAMAIAFALPMIAQGAAAVEQSGDAPPYDSVFAAMRAGARGYVLEDADDEDLARAIRAVGRGDAIFSPAVAARVIDFFARPPAAAVAHFPELTESERRVLALMARGEANARIAERLSLSPKTVRNYCSNIFAKLQMADRTAAIVRAREVGMGRDEPA